MKPGWLLPFCLGFFLAVFTTDALACSCAPAHGIENRTEIAFLGRIVGRRAIVSEEDPEFEYTLIVVRAGRGVRVGQRVRVRTPPFTTMCGFYLTVGMHFVVYGERLRRNPQLFSTSLCLRSYGIETRDHLREELHTWRAAPIPSTGTDQEVEPYMHPFPTRMR